MYQEREIMVDFIKKIMPSKMKAKTILWWVTFNAVGLWWYSAITSKPLDGSIAIMYTAIVGAFAGSKGYEAYQNKCKDPKNMGTDGEGN